MPSRTRSKVTAGVLALCLAALVVAAVAPNGLCFALRVLAAKRLNQAVDSGGTGVPPPAADLKPFP
jgi:hypothetical protein